MPDTDVKPTQKKYGRMVLDLDNAEFVSGPPPTPKEIEEAKALAAAVVRIIK